MAVTLTGFKGGVSTQTEKAGVDAFLQSVKADKTTNTAGQLLMDLRADLRSKTGVVRLLHTSDANKNMKFKNSGAFKQFFVSGDKLKKSGEVISDLLAAAGMPPSKVDAFNKYVEARGKDGVKAQVVLQYIDSMHAETGDSAAEALSKFGVDITQRGKLLGDGAYGEVHTVTYRGQEFVYKQPSSKSNQPLGSLMLADASGKAIVPKAGLNVDEEGNREPSFKNASTSEIKPFMLIESKQQVQIKNNNSYMYESSNADKDSFIYKSQTDNNLLLNLMRAQNLLSQDSQDNDAVSSFEADNGHFQPLVDEAKFAKPQEVNRPPLIVEEEYSAPQPMTDERFPAQAPSTSANSLELAREGIANASRVKDLPQVITPTVYVVKETNVQGNDQFHAVAGQWRLKDWARVQSADSRFEVVGLLMPKAAGNHPWESKTTSGKEDEQELPPKVHVARTDLKPMATSAMSLLKGLASHGFIHGDIKSTNLMWDPKSKTLQLIDNDSLEKVSKKNDDIKPGIDVHTQAYLNPVAWKARAGNNAQLGLGRDLFAIGVVLLETSLGAKGRHKEADEFLDQLTFLSEPKEKGKYLMSQGKYSRGVGALTKASFSPNSVEAFARSCIIKSIEYEEARLKNNDFKFERFTPNNDQHLLAQLERELEQIH